MDAWRIRFEGERPEEERLREALTTLANGVIGTRGAAEDAPPGDGHYPGTYLAGGYDRAVSLVEGQAIERESLVNFPNWLPLSVGPHGLEPSRAETLACSVELDLARGLLERRRRVRDRAGRAWEVASTRLVHMARPELAAIRVAFAPCGWSGRVEIVSALDGDVVNAGVGRHEALEGRHLRLVDAGGAGGGLVRLVVETLASRIRMAQVARTHVSIDGEEVDGAPRVHGRGARILQRFALDLPEGSVLTVEKLVAIRSSRDFAIETPERAAIADATDAPSFDELVASHERAWQRLWKRCDLDIDGPEEEQRLLRLYLFHLLQTLSPNVVDRDVGVPARGLSEAYFGHVFWDELFVFPLLDLHLPEVARALLMYRSRRLPAARRRAREAGLAGAMYPWQSASSGTEETPAVEPSPLTGKLREDRSGMQVHVNAAIAYDVWHYVEATGDVAFLEDHGAEMVLEIARLFASLAELDRNARRYSIRGVVGPDEFHTGYPGTDRPGIDDDAYTNVMAVWTLRCAERAIAALPRGRAAEVLEDLGIGDAERDLWADIARRMRVPFLEDGTIAQFAGYEALDDRPVEELLAFAPTPGELPEALRLRNDSVLRYRVAKQADVLMLFYLLSARELADLLGGLGYPFDAGDISRTIELYAARTVHGSSLSRVVHAWVLARSDRVRSYELFERSLHRDVDPRESGTTGEGVHLGAMAGTVDLVMRGYTGLAIHDDVLWLKPRLPDPIAGVRLTIRYRSAVVDIEVQNRELGVSVREARMGPVTIDACGERVRLGEGESHRVPIGGPRRVKRAG